MPAYVGKEIQLRRRDCQRTLRHFEQAPPPSCGWLSEGKYRGLDSRQGYDFVGHPLQQRAWRVHPLMAWRSVLLKCIHNWVPARPQRGEHMLQIVLLWSKHIHFFLNKVPLQRNRMPAYQKPIRPTGSSTKLISFPIFFARDPPRIKGDPFEVHNSL